MMLYEFELWDQDDADRLRDLTDAYGLSELRQMGIDRPIPFWHKDLPEVGKDIERAWEAIRPKLRPFWHSNLPVPVFFRVSWRAIPTN